MSVPFRAMSQGVLGRRKPGLAYRRRSTQRWRPPAGKLRFEPLEKRFLLSADLLSPGIADALSGGLNEIDAVLDSSGDIVSADQTRFGTNFSESDTEIGLVTSSDPLGAIRAARLTAASLATGMERRIPGDSAS